MLTFVGAVCLGRLCVQGVILEPIFKNSVIRRDGVESLRSSWRTVYCFDFFLAYQCHCLGTLVIGTPMCIQFVTEYLNVLFFSPWQCLFGIGVLVSFQILSCIFKFLVEFAPR